MAAPETKPDTGQIVVSTGDVAGVSPELIPVLLSAADDGEKLHFVGPASLRDRILDNFDRSNFRDNVSWTVAGSISPDHISSGDPNSVTGDVAYKSFRRAMEIGRESDDSSLITLPLSKQAVQAAGYDQFIGHTEELEDFFGTEAVMSFFGDDFNVALLTRHCPVSSVEDKLNTDQVVRIVRTVHDFYHESGVSDPRFALLGLDPHAGEDGSIGTADRDILQPAVESLRDTGIHISGPHPADSFLPVKAEDVELIFASYHDQGLVPFKQRHFHSGVHASLGLPILRVSPDHGVAEDLAGTGRVNPGSTIRSFEWIRDRKPVEK